MPTFTSDELYFLALYKNAVWHTAVEPREHADWNAIFELARSQTVIGMIADSVGNLPAACKPSMQQFLPQVAITSTIIEGNRKMNDVLFEILTILQGIAVSPWLLKGQGVAQNYIKPEIRQSGDIDLYFKNRTDLEKSLDLMRRKPETTFIEYDNVRMHATFTYKDIVVEYHGSIHGKINKTTFAHTPLWVDRMFVGQSPRIWERNGERVFLPPATFDVLFIFLHLARHYFGSAVGLRQITDWMRYLYVLEPQINQTQLLSDIRYLGLTKAWSVFGTMAVDLLGFPQDKMPLYNPKYSAYGKKVLRHILDSGNFGYHDKRTQSDSKYYIVRKFVAMTGHLQMIFRNAVMFPRETLYALPNFFTDGFGRFFKNW